MIKLIRLFGLFVIVCLIYGLGSAFNGNESTKINDEQKEQSTETVENDSSEKSVSTNYADESNNYQTQKENDRCCSGSFSKQPHFADLKYTKYIFVSKTCCFKKFLAEHLIIVFQCLPTAGRELHPALKI